MRRAIRVAPILVLAAVASARSPARAATYTWTGGGANSNWSNNANWQSGAPANNETGLVLVFPALAGAYASNNDRSGLQVDSVSVTTQIAAGTYTLSGNPITLHGPVSWTNPGTGSPNLLWQIPLVLAADVALSTSGRQSQLEGSVDLQSHTLTFEALGDVLLSGTVSGSGGIVKNGSSALTLSGANTYTGPSTGNAGALYINSASALGGVATGTVINDGSLGFLGATFSTSEPVVFHGGTILAYGMPSLLGPLTLDKVVPVRVFANARLTLAGAIGGSGGLEKRELGVLILAPAVADYSGPTSAAAGTLQLDGDLVATASLTVQTGATLTGNGSSAAAIDVQSGATLAPGSSPGRLRAGGLTMSAGATLVVEINGASAGTDYDQVAVNGPVDLGGATLSVALAHAPVDGDSFALVAQQQDRAVVGAFANLPEGANLVVDGRSFHITYRGGSGGDDVALIAGTTPPATEAPPSPTTADTPSPTLSPAASLTPTRVASPTPSPTTNSTATPGSCTGDCDDNRVVAIAELVRAVNIALGGQPVSVCPQADPDGDERVTVAELIRCVGRALDGC